MQLRFSPALPALAFLFFFSACATTPPAHQQAGIGPYTSLSARLLVIEPNRRWQVLLDWQANRDGGRARLVHAASNIVVELRWQHNDIRLRDNRSPEWRKVSLQELVQHGIVISPHALSRFFSGHVPEGFHRKKPNLWENTRGGKLIRVVWHANARRLVISDIRHGRRATLLILKAEGKPSSATDDRHD